VKIDVTTGRPKDVYVYYGEGQDETCGLAVKETNDGKKVLVVSGHFVGSLTADYGDGTSTTIYNSNANGTADFVLHPNAIKNGQDDGFVISADADTGDANWIVAYPTSTKDSQTVGVDLDSDGNIYGAGYACNESGDGSVVCDGFVAKFSAADGAVMWEKKYTDLGAAMWIVYDGTDDALYVTGTTSYKGDGKDSKIHQSCNYDTCAVTMRLSAVDGEMDWVRTVQGSPRWNFFDQTGDIRLANDLDGPYIYVALDDAGENGVITLDEGTPYAGCLDENGVLTPEYMMVQNSVMTEDDCRTSTFVSRSDVNAYPASNAATGATCGAGHDAVDACIIKYHKYTGLPIWGSDIHPVASIVPSSDGQSVMAVGFYWRSDTYGYNFDSVKLPDYNGVEGAYNAKLNAETGKGEYVMHSGGVGKTRPYDAVGSPEGDVYIVGYTQSAVLNWGGTLQTKIIEEGTDQNDDGGTAFQMGKVSSNTNEYQFFTVKLGSSESSMASCVESCSLEGGMVANPVIKAGYCLIDNVCYIEDSTAEIFGRPCQVCKPETSQTEWSNGDVIGEQTCFINNICVDQGDFYNFRVSRRENYDSVCQMCDPASNGFDWSVKFGFALNGTAEPPNDCMIAYFEGVCFSGRNKVEVEDSRGMISMDSLRIGDSVRVKDGKFSKVYSFGHRDTGVVVNYLQIKTNEFQDPLEISHIHMLFVQDGATTKSVPASTIKVGDMILTENGNTAKVRNIKNVQRKGAYAPFTTSGDIVVNGLLASNYVSLMEETTVIPVTMQWIAHTFKAPHRMLCSLNFAICKNETYDSGGLSTWIITPFHGGQWLAKQNTVIKFMGITVLVSALLVVSMVETIMFSPVLLLSIIIAFGFFLNKLNNRKMKKSNKIA